MGGRGAGAFIPSGSSGKWSGNVGLQVADNLKDALGTRGTPKSMGDAMLSTNPHYNGDYKEFSQNCQRVVVAYEARRRGYDVEALPTYRGDTLSHVAYEDQKSGVARGRWMGAFQDAKPVNVSSNKHGANAQKEVMSNIDKQLENAGEGSRGVVQIFYKNGGGHVFNVERKNGKTQYIEAQSGHVKDFGKTLENVKTGKVAFVRTDNLKFSDRAKNFVTSEK